MRIDIHAPPSAAPAVLTPHRKLPENTAPPRDTLHIGHKGVTPDGLFSLEEVECIGACCWAPAIQINYDFHDDLTTEKVDVLFQIYRDGQGKDVK